MGWEQFLGAWRLTAVELLTPEGIAQTLRLLPAGFAIFSAEGYVSAHLYAPARPSFSSMDGSAWTPEEMAAVFRGVAGYFGKCDIDYDAQTWATHVEGSLIPNWVGSDQVRTYEFRDGKLAVTAPPIPSPIDGAMVTPTYVYERVE